jgi:hypothetical protein
MQDAKDEEDLHNKLELPLSFTNLCKYQGDQIGFFKYKNSLSFRTLSTVKVMQ